MTVIGCRVTLRKEGRSRFIAMAALMMMDEECPLTCRSIPSVRDMEGV